MLLSLEASVTQHISDLLEPLSEGKHYCMCAGVPNTVATQYTQVHSPEDMSSDQSHFLPGQLTLLPPTLHLPPEHQPETPSAPPTCSEPAAETPHSL